MASGIANLGGATLDLQGGEYLISAPLAMPDFRGECTALAAVERGRGAEEQRGSLSWGGPRGVAALPFGRDRASFSRGLRRRWGPLL